MEKKLICEVCGGDKWSKGQELVLTSYPPIHQTDYICIECGNMYTHRRRENLADPTEVYITEEI
jgi:hypothetical protein